MLHINPLRCFVQASWCSITVVSLLVTMTPLQQATSNTRLKKAEAQTHVQQPCEVLHIAALAQKVSFISHHKRCT
jgi:hypothetical protein